MKRRKLEEVVFFGDRFGGTAAIGTVVARLGIVHIELVEDAILAGVAAFVDVAVVQAALEQPLHCFVVLRVGGADEGIVLKAQRVPLTPELGGDGVGELFRRLARGLRGALHLLAVLVRAGGEEHIVAQHPPEPLDGVGGERGVGVADVRRRIDVVKRRREVVFHFVIGWSGKRDSLRR